MLQLLKTQATFPCLACHLLIYVKGSLVVKVTTRHCFLYVPNCSLYAAETKLEAPGLNKFIHVPQSASRIHACKPVGLLAYGYYS